MGRFRWIALVAVLAATPALAADGLDISRLRSLVESGQMEEAYALAEAHVDSRAGDPAFDLFYGIAAIDTGHVDAGVFALERVLTQRPGLDRARVEYARGLYLLEDDLRSRRQFEIVLAQDPPPAVVDRIERYLAAIERRADRYRTKVTGHVGVDAGYDDNANRAPSAESIDLGFATLQLGDDSREEDDYFLGANAGVNLSRPLIPGLNLIASADIDLLRHQHNPEFDTSRLGGRVGLRWRKDDHRLSGVVEGDRFYVAHDPYQGAGGLAFNYRYRFNDRLAAHATARYTRVRYDQLEALDSNITWLGGGVSYSWSAPWNPRGSVTLLVGEEDAEESTRRARALAQRDMVELRARFAVTPARNWTLRSGLRWRESEYDTNTFPFADARDEDYYSLDVALDWRPTVNWRFGPYISYTDNDANIELYDYERTAVGLEARYTFF